LKLDHACEPGQAVRFNALLANASVCSFVRLRGEDNGKLRCADGGLYDALLRCDVVPLVLRLVVRGVLAVTLADINTVIRRVGAFLAGLAVQMAVFDFYVEGQGPDDRSRPCYGKRGLFCR
jgi:hypothetical protein